MIGAGLRSEVKMYWRMMQCLLEAERTGIQDADALDEIDTLAAYTSNDNLRRLCISAIAHSRPMRAVGDPS